jgi:starch phosphorylase
VTHRRWLAYSNPELGALITDAIGDGWLADFSQIKKLEPFAGDASFRQRFRAVKRARKEKLAELVRKNTGVELSPDHVFDVQIKRIHEYKRQLLHVLQIVDEYLGLIERGEKPASPVVHIFAGKAAPGYAMAKLIIKLVNNVAKVINEDERADGHIRVLFVPDYRVSLAERLIPAADISEQISTAGMEASGTSNMKLAMNGALTLGTMDGANIEIVEEVGRENAYIFGLTAAEVAEYKRKWSYRPSQIYQENQRIRAVVDALLGDRFCPGEPGLFRQVGEKLLNDGEQYFHLADFESYTCTKQKLLRDYLNRDAWSRAAVLNIARSGKFSSDRTIREYAEDIWNIAPVL